MVLIWVNPWPAEFVELKWMKLHSQTMEFITGCLCLQVRAKLNADRGDIERREKAMNALQAPVERIGVGLKCFQKHNKYTIYSCMTHVSQM